MTTHTQRVKLGVFLVVGGVASVALLTAFAGLDLWQDYDHYDVVVQDTVQGIDVGTSVTRMGLRVGVVDAVEVVGGGNAVQLRLAVRAGTELHEGAQAYLSMSGVTGRKVVDIRGGDASKPALAPGTRLPRGETTLDKLESELGVLLETATNVVSSTDRLVRNLEAISASIDGERLGNTLIVADRAVRELEGASRTLHAMIDENRAPVRGTVRDVRATAAHFAGVASQAEALLGDLANTVTDMRGVVHQNRDELRATAENLRDASRSFKRLGRELRNEPSRLLLGSARKARELPDE